MGLRETVKQAAGAARQAADDTSKGIALLCSISLVILGVAILMLVTGRQVLRAVRADGDS